MMDGRKPDKEHLEKTLDMLGLKERRDHLPSQMSGGQQQRVSIGRALFTSPQVILADEPTGNLDSKNSAEIMELFRRSNKELKQTIIIITHDEKIAEQCDRIIVLSDGKIISDEGNSAHWEADSNDEI
jgi:putative ABC transport system ATP-binding protein